MSVCACQTCTGSQGSVRGRKLAELTLRDSSIIMRV
jgi:hypothetical protein